MTLDRSQRNFCESTAQNIRLLAPAGCGKTHSLLYRIQELARRAPGKERFLVVTFTKGAAVELETRLDSNTFSHLRNQVVARTLNAFGFRSLREQYNSTRLLKTTTDRCFALKNQLHPVWAEHEHIAQAVNGQRANTRRIFDAMDTLKSLGFDHTTDTNEALFRQRLETLNASWLAPQIKLLFDELTQMRILDSRLIAGEEAAADSPRQFYSRFFRFWREGTQRLHDELTFTFEDQKYKTWLQMRPQDEHGNIRSRITGAPRYHHILVDEFQDINPLDHALISALVERHRSTLTIVGDDDQAIFEWRGASPDYILDPDEHFGKDFETHILDTNYRSPANVVYHARQLISHNVRREPKEMHSADQDSEADISVVPSESISERLQMVTEIARGMSPGERVAVIGRLRSQLIPYEVYYAAEGGDVKTASDLDAFSSQAFEKLMSLLELWEDRERRRGASQIANRLVEVCESIRRAPFSKKNRQSVLAYLGASEARTLWQGAVALMQYDGPKLSGKSHEQLSDVATRFFNAEHVWDAVVVIADSFDGLKLDREKAEDHAWFTDPPLKQLAEMARGEQMEVDALIERLAAAKLRVQHTQSEAGEDDPSSGDHALELMTATRAKGKEFDTVILLDVCEEIWPYKRTDTQAQLEAERRLFYVAFTRAKQRIVMLTQKDAPISRFVRELNPTQ